MDHNTFIYTLPQWFVFAAFIAYVYGWVEKKKIFRLTGLVIIFLLGIFAIYSIYSGYFSAYEFLTPEEITNEEMPKDIPGEIPFEVQLLPAYLNFFVSALFSVPAFILELNNNKLKNLFLICTGILALLGFFIIVGAVKTL